MKYARIVCATIFLSFLICLPVRADELYKSYNRIHYPAIKTEKGELYDWFNPPLPEPEDCVSFWDPTFIRHAMNAPFDVYDSAKNLYEYKVAGHNKIKNSYDYYKNLEGKDLTTEDRINEYKKNYYPLIELAYLGNPVFYNEVKMDSVKESYPENHPHWTNHPKSETNIILADKYPEGVNGNKVKYLEPQSMQKENAQKRAETTFNHLFNKTDNSSKRTTDRVFQDKIEEIEKQRFNVGYSEGKYYKKTPDDFRVGKQYNNSWNQSYFDDKSEKHYKVLTEEDIAFVGDVQTDYIKQKDKEWRDKQKNKERKEGEEEYGLIRLSPDLPEPLPFEVTRLNVTWIGDVKTKYADPKVKEDCIATWKEYNATLQAQEKTVVPPKKMSIAEYNREVGKRLRRLSSLNERVPDKFAFDFWDFVTSRPQEEPTDVFAINGTKESQQYTLSDIPLDKTQAEPIADVEVPYEETPTIVPTKKKTFTVEPKKKDFLIKEDGTRIYEIQGSTEKRKFYPDATLMRDIRTNEVRTFEGWGYNTSEPDVENRKGFLSNHSYHGTNWGIEENDTSSYYTTEPPSRYDREKLERRKKVSFIESSLFSPYDIFDDFFNQARKQQPQEDLINASALNETIDAGLLEDVATADVTAYDNVTFVDNETFANLTETIDTTLQPDGIPEVVEEPIEVITEEPEAEEVIVEVIDIPVVEEPVALVDCWNGRVIENNGTIVYVWNNPKQKRTKIRFLTPAMARRLSEYELSVFANPTHTRGGDINAWTHKEGDEGIDAYKQEKCYTERDMGLFEGVEISHNYNTETGKVEQIFIHLSETDIVEVELTK